MTLAAVGLAVRDKV